MNCTAFEAVHIVRPSVELRARLEELLREKAAIKASIDSAKRAAAQSGIYSDRAWLVSAERANRLKGVAVLSLQNELGIALRRERADENTREQKTFERQFMAQAHALLPESLYAEILRRTVEATKEGGNTGEGEGR